SALGVAHRERPQDDRAALVVDELSRFRADCVWIVALAWSPRVPPWADGRRDLLGRPSGREALQPRGPGRFRRAWHDRPGRQAAPVLDPGEPAPRGPRARARQARTLPTRPYAAASSVGVVADGPQYSKVAHGRPPNFPMPPVAGGL